ncbi:MAG: hypothetical protein HN404_15740 [Gemmatimonadetes bacterium]|nr:hypothetical protein [Gemmatimonadota bacterium]
MKNTPGKQLPLPGEVFDLDGNTAFLITPPRSDTADVNPIPWVWYAPTLPGLPGAEEAWMFTQFLHEGMAIAGIDVGESYGSPAGRASFTAFHQELTEVRGLSSKACLFARSRGGLMLYNWAVEHPDCVASIAGIYPVCSPASYPGAETAAPAYGLTTDQFIEELPNHDPLERLAPLAAANVPIFHIHGDSDTVVPLEANSARLARRYDELAAPMTLRVIEGGGHDMWDGWFRCEELVDFIIEHRLGWESNQATQMTFESAACSAGARNQEDHPHSPRRRTSILDDEARVDEAAFFAQLSRDVVGLQTVHEAVDRQNWLAARQALAQYFLQRDQPRWTFDWRDPAFRLDRFVDRSHTWGTVQLASLHERVDALLADEFVDAAGAHHDISNLKGFLHSGLRFGEQAQYITMFIWAMDLGEMHARTGDSVYARRFSELFTAYDDAFPRIVTNHDPDHPWLDETIPPTWHEMFVGKAAIHLLSLLYTGLLHDPVVGHDVVYRVIRKLWFHAAQFTRFTHVRSYKHYNHHWYERGTCPFVLGLLLPEFDGFEPMRDRGRQVINDHLEGDFFPDGTYREHSTSYQSSTLAIDLLFPWTVAHANRASLVEEPNLPVVHSWLGWYASMTQPNGELPPIGDAFGAKSIGRLGRGAVLTASPGLKGFVESLAACATTEPDGSNRDNALGLEDSLLPDWEALCTEQPAYTSAVFADGGWVALRDSWDPDATYCAMSAINSPDGKNHGHWDLLHFTLFARGQSLLADPASWIYNGYYTAERRGYLYSMAAHNVLTIDDDQLLSKRQLCPIWTGDVPSCTIRAKALHERVDFVSASHDAYAPQRHTRELLLVRDRYLLVLDYVTSEDVDWIHTYRRLLHFDFDVDVTTQSDRLVARRGAASLICVPVAEGGVSLTIERDEYLEIERAKLGYTELPWVTQIKSEQASTAAMAMLLYPQTPSEDPSIADDPVVSIRSLALSSADTPLHASTAVAYEITTPRGTDRICRNFDAPDGITLGTEIITAPIWVDLSGEGPSASRWSGSIEIEPSA